MTGMAAFSDAIPTMPHCVYGVKYFGIRTTLYTCPGFPRIRLRQRYVYQVGLNNKSFQIYARLENTKDISIQTDGSGDPQAYQGLSCGSKLCNYGVASANVSPNQGKTLVTE
jgi:hypothetical protein